MKIISVIPFKKGILKGDLTYFSSLDISIGDIISVPLRGKTTLALVTSTEELKTEKSNVKKMNFNLKKVIENKGPSIILPEFLNTIFDSSKYFAQNKNNAIASLIPNLFIEKYNEIAKFTNLKIENPNERPNTKILKTEKLLLQYGIEDRISTYKTLVRESFARGKSIFMVLPTEFDIAKFTLQLSKGIEQFTFSIHSGISAKNNLITYKKIITSSHPVLIIGTPPFLAIPRRDIGIIILEHESSNAYKMIRRPHFDLRIFAEIYASKINAKFIIADEMLRFETIGKKDIENLNPLYPLSFRIDFTGDIEIQNPKALLLESPQSKPLDFKIFSEQTVEKIKSTLENKKNVFIFSLRKGLATMTVCKDCGETINCEKCGAPLVLYTSHQGKKRIFVCNRCQTDIDGDTVCPDCGGWNLMPLGVGTDTVYEEVKRLFPLGHSPTGEPKVKIFKLDKESTKNSTGAKKVIKEFGENSGSILIGTEMAFFYLKEKINLSIIASFDSLWSIPNFKMSEKIIQIILSIINNTERKLIIQTKNENDVTLRAVKSGNLLPFVREELEDRKKLGYLPYKRFIKISHLGNKEQTTKAKKILEETFESYSPVIFSGFVSKLQDKYVTNALIKIDPKKWSLPEISANSSIDENLLNKLHSLQPTFEIYVDPEDLL
jgi:primosomal protein N' (replication factor Y)